MISTHTLTWSVTIAGVKLINALYDFNSHAHVERDLWGYTHFHIILISTHTLTWSVTRVILAISLQILISTHTLTWSVTNADETKFDEIVISTHTLTWSVTPEMWRILQILKFQLTRSRGA